MWGQKSVPEILLDISFFLCCFYACFQGFLFTDLAFSHVTGFWNVSPVFCHRGFPEMFFWKVGHEICAAIILRSAFCDLLFYPKNTINIYTNHLNLYDLYGYISSNSNFFTKSVSFFSTTSTKIHCLSCHKHLIIYDGFLCLYIPQQLFVTYLTLGGVEQPLEAKGILLKDPDVGKILVPFQRAQGSPKNSPL